MLQLDWNATINSIREALPQTQFQNWFKPVEFIRCDESSVVLGVPSRFHEEWLRSHYSDQITEAIRNQCGSALQLEFEVLIRDENVEAARPLAPVVPHRAALRIVESNPLPVPIEAPNVPPFHHPYFSFAFNHVAVSCVGMFIEGRDLQLNPLILMGGVGMGKTHLLAEIGKNLHCKLPGLRIRYTNGEAFTAEMYRYLKSNDMPTFKRKYSEETDCLLFDDVQDLSKRMKTQEGLLHIFNDILNRGGRIAFSTSVSPNRLEDFIEPLRSRLLSGVLAEVKFPSHEDKVALLNKVAAHNRMQVDPVVMRSLADKGQKDVRELIGTLLRVHLQAKLENRPLDGEFIAREGWERESQKEAITLSEIVSLVEHNFAICRSEMVSKSRKGTTTWARQVAMYLARHYTLLPLEEIGKTFGRDHATVIHAFQKVTETMEKHPTRRYEVEFLKQKLQSRAPRRPGDIV